MSTWIVSRKPVPSLNVATRSSKRASVPDITPTISEQELVKDIEKSPAEERICRVSTDVDSLSPVPAHDRLATGIENTGLNEYTFANPRKFQTEDLKLSTGTWTKGLFGRRDQHFGGQKKYFGLSRRYFLLSILALVVIILALAIGLGVGLRKSHGAQNLPLPTNKDVHTGDLTYYEPGLGACGKTNKDSDSIVAVSHLVFDAVRTGSDPNQNPLCGKKIRTSRYNEKTGSQRSVDLTVVDRCVGCRPMDIDVTTSVFDQLADRDAGRVVTTWAWLDIDII